MQQRTPHGDPATCAKPGSEEGSSREGGQQPRSGIRAAYKGRSGRQPGAERVPPRWWCNGQEAHRGACWQFMRRGNSMQAIWPNDVCPSSADPCAPLPLLTRHAVLADRGCAPSPSWKAPTPLCHPAWHHVCRDRPPEHRLSGTRLLTHATPSTLPDPWHWPLLGMVAPASAAAITQTTRREHRCRGGRTWRRASQSSSGSWRATPARSPSTRSST